MFTKTISLCSVFAFFSCSFIASKGFLNEAPTSGSLDPVQLQRYCDLEDPAACYINGKEPLTLKTSVPIFLGLGGQSKQQIVIAAQLPKHMKSKWYLLKPGKILERIEPSATYTKVESPIRVEHLTPIGLEPEVNYELILASEEGSLIDLRNFRIPNRQVSPKKIAIVSCSDDRQSQDGNILWRQLVDQKPNLVLAIGDNAYLDWQGGQRVDVEKNPSLIWQRHVETREALDVFRSRELIPMLAVWDDHDFGKNDGDQTFTHIDEARKTFEIFFPSLHDSKTLLQGPGVSKAISWGKFHFLLLDDRSFRSPNLIPSMCNNSNHSLCLNRKTPQHTFDEFHFGRVQEDWAKKFISDRSGLFWLVSGDQWFGNYHPFESFEGNHPNNFKHFLSDLHSITRKSRDSEKSYLFVSGDRHLSEIMRVKPFRRYETYELTSSGIHAYMFANAWKDFPNPRQIKGVSGEINYSTVELLLETKDSYNFLVTSWTTARKLYEQEIKIPIVRGSRSRKSAL